MQNKQRAAQVKDFLTHRVGLKKYRILSMGLDASSRKYFRIVLMMVQQRFWLMTRGATTGRKNLPSCQSFC